MVEDGRQSIIEEIVKKRAIESKRVASVEEASSQIPEFVTRLHSLIRNKIPAPVEELVHWEEYFRMRSDSFLYQKNDYPTNLNAKVRTEAGTINVDIATNIYPSGKDDNAPVKYRIDVKDLDYYLKLENGKWYLESKLKDSDMPSDSMNVVIGHQYNTWPAWKRDVTMEDANRFKGLLSILESGNDVDFQGSTPKMRVVDESTRPQIRATRAK